MCPPPHLHPAPTEGADNTKPLALLIYTSCKVIGAPLQPFSATSDTHLFSATIMWSYPRAVCCSGQLLLHWQVMVSDPASLCHKAT